MVSNQFGSRLKEIREQAGLSQREVCERAGLTLDGLSKLERGLRSPSWDTVVALANALGVSCEAFRESPATEQPPGKPGRPKKTTQPTPTIPASTGHASESGDHSKGNAPAEQPGASGGQPEAGKGKRSRKPKS